MIEWIGNKVRFRIRLFMHDLNVKYLESARLKLARRLPRWLRHSVLIAEAIDHIRDHEIVPEVPFTTILQRSYGDSE